MKKIACLFLCIFISLCGINAAAANSKYMVEAGENSGVILSLNGTLDSGASGRRVTIEVLKPDITVANLAAATPDNVKTMLYDVIQVTSSQGGVYSADVYFSNDTSLGDYVIRVSAYGESDKFAEYYFISESSLDDIRTSINTSKNDTEIKNFIDDFIDMTKFSFAEFDSENINIYKGILSEVNKLKNSGLKGFSSSLDIMEAIKRQSIFAKTSTGNESNIAELFSQYESILNLSSANKYSEFNSSSFTAAMKTKVYKGFIGEKFASEQEFLTEFDHQVVLAKINSISNYNQLSVIINADGLLIGMDMDTYRRYNTNNAVDIILARTTNYTSITHFLTAVDSAINSIKNPTPPGIGNNGGGGGGGGVTSPTSVIEFKNDAETPATQNADKQWEGFKDIEDVDWASSAINNLASTGVISRTDYFRPNDNIVREEFIKLLVEAFNLKSDGATCDFADVNAEEWYCSYIASAQEVGITKGKSDGSFGVGEQITRQDAASMVYRTMEIIGKTLSVKNETAHFTDESSIADYAMEAVRSMQTGGVINGMEDGRFAPLETATRAQAAKIIYMILENAR